MKKNKIQKSIHMKFNRKIKLQNKKVDPFLHQLVFEKTKWSLERGVSLTTQVPSVVPLIVQSYRKNPNMWSQIQ